MWLAKRGIHLRIARPPRTALTWRPQDLGRGGDVGQPVLAAIQVMLTFQDVEPSSQVVGPVSWMPSCCVWL
jgi:hypothetical protein